MKNLRTFILCFLLSGVGVELKASVLSDFLLIEYCSEQNSTSFYKEAGGPTLPPEVAKSQHISQMRMVHATMGYYTTVLFCREGFVTDMVGGEVWHTFTYDSILLKKGIRRVKTMEEKLASFDPMPVLKRNEYYYNAAGDIDSIRMYEDRNSQSYVDVTGKMRTVFRFRYEPGRSMEKVAVEDVNWRRTYTYTYNSRTNIISRNEKEFARYHKSFTPPANDRLWLSPGASLDTLQPGDTWFEPLSEYAHCKRDAKGRITSRTYADCTCTFTYNAQGLPATASGTCSAEVSEETTPQRFRFDYERYE